MHISTFWGIICMPKHPGDKVEPNEGEPTKLEPDIWAVKQPA